MSDSGELPVLGLGLFTGAERGAGSGNVAERYPSGKYAVAGAEEEK